MHYTIYKITNKINGKFYIGKHQTKDLNDGYMGSGKIIRSSIQKYGIENFTKEILFNFESEKEMNLKESELVTEQFCSNENTYNICPGGKGGFGYINQNILTKQQRQKNGSIGGCVSNTIENNKVRSKKVKEKMLEHHQNGKYKHINKMSPNALKRLKDIDTLNKRKETFSQINHQQGSKNSQYGTCWITNGQENKKIKKGELDFWLEKGFKKGRMIKISLDFKTGLG